MAVPNSEAVQWLPSGSTRAESRSGRIGPISLGAKQTGERSARNPHAAFDEAGAGNVAWPRWCDTRNRKSEPKTLCPPGPSWRDQMRGRSSRLLLFPIAVILVGPAWSLTSAFAGGSHTRNSSVIANCAAEADAKQLTGQVRHIEIKNCFRRSCLHCILWGQLYDRSEFH